MSSSSTRTSPSPLPPRPPLPTRTQPLNAPASRPIPPLRRSNQEKYFARVARDDLAPGRMSKILAYVGWGSAIAIIGWMTLYEDFGEKEHCFTPIRRYYRGFMRDMFNLSPSEQSMLGINRRLSSLDPRARVMEPPEALQQALKKGETNPT